MKNIFLLLFIVSSCMKFEPKEAPLVPEEMSNEIKDTLINETSTPTNESFDIFPQLLNLIEGRWIVTGYGFTQLPENPNNLNDIELSNTLDNPNRQHIIFSENKGQYVDPEEIIGGESTIPYGYEPKENDPTLTNIARFASGCEQTSDSIALVPILYTTLAFREIDPDDHPAIEQAREKFPDHYIYGFSVHPWEGYYLISEETGCASEELFGCDAPGNCAHRDVYLCFFTEEGNQLNVLQDAKQEDFLEVFEWYKVEQ